MNSRLCNRVPNLNIVPRNILCHMLLECRDDLFHVWVLWLWLLQLLWFVVVTVGSRCCITRSVAMDGIVRCCMCVSTC